MHPSSLSLSPLSSSPLPAAGRRLSPLPRAAARSLPAGVYPQGGGWERGIRSRGKSKKVTLIPPAFTWFCRMSPVLPRPATCGVSDFSLFSILLSLSPELIFYLFSNIKSPPAIFNHQSSTASPPACLACPGCSCRVPLRGTPGVFPRALIHRRWNYSLFSILCSLSPWNCSSLVPRNNSPFSFSNQQSTIYNHQSKLLPSSIRSSFRSSKTNSWPAP